MEKRIGNFIIKEYGNDVSRVKIEAVSKIWNVSWQEGTLMYSIIVDAMNRGEEEILEPIIVANYLVGNVPLDKQGWDELFKIFNDFSLRAGVAVSDGEDKEIIDEIKEMYVAGEIDKEEEE